LIFIVATIKDQLSRDYSSETANQLINILGLMLPFGFVVLPIVATMLHTQPMVGLQLANEVGFLYGGVMSILATNILVANFDCFPHHGHPPSIGDSIGPTFGFANYGVLFGVDQWHC
jgi:hypothetical protein